MIIELSSKDFDEQARGGVVVALFYSGSNGMDPKKLIQPATERTYTETVKFATVDIDTSPEIARRYGATVFPAVLFMRNGIVKKLMQMADDPQKIADEAVENACFRCSVTRSRMDARKNRKFKS